MAFGPGQVRWRVKMDSSASWSARLKDRVSTELRDAAARTLSTAENLAPVRTGELKASGKVNEITEFHYQVTFGEGLPDARAVFQEFGTAHHVAQPYLAPAYQSELHQLMRRLAITTQGRVRLDPGGLGGADAELGGSGGVEVVMG